MNRFQGILPVVLMLLLVWPDFSRAEESKSARGIFKLGVVVPLSGKAEALGKAHKQAALFLREVEEELDRSVLIIYEDSLSTTAGALSAFRKLVEVDQVNAVYAVGADLLPALAPLAEEEKVPFFAPETDISQASGRHYTTLFRNDAAEFMRALWEQLRIEKKSKLVVFKNRDSEMNVMVKALSENTMEGESVQVRFDELAGAKKFNKSLASLKKESFDALGLFLISPSLAGALSELTASGIKTPIVGVGTLYEGGVVAGSEKQLEGALMVAPYVTPEFRDRFKVAAGSEAGVEYAGTFYDFLSLLNQEIRDHEGPFENGLAFIQAMRFQDERRGIAGPMAVKTTASGATYVSLPLAVYRIVGGAPVVQRLFERPR